MTYIKINGTTYPATVNGFNPDITWDNRESKAITLEMSHAEALELFMDGIVWSIVLQHEVATYQQDENGNYVLDENGAPIQTGNEVKETEYDNSDYCVAGDITDHRNGTITVKMGKPTQVELLESENAALLFENLTGEAM